MRRMISINQNNFTKMKTQGYNQGQNQKHVAHHISFQDLRKVLERNPHKSHTLHTTTIINKSILDEVRKCPLPAYYHIDDINIKVKGDDIFEAKTLIELILILKNMEYVTAQKSRQDKLYQEKLLDIQQKLDISLKGTPYVRNKKRLIDAFSSEGSGGTVGAITKDPLLADVLCFLEDIQLIAFKGDNTDLKDAMFIPSDPRTWSHDKKIYIVDITSIGFNGLSCEIPSKVMAKYIDHLEYSDPIVMIKWPVATGTKDELLQVLAATVSDESLIKKEKKDVLAEKVGRTQTLAHFSKWKTAAIYDDI